MNLIFLFPSRGPKYRWGAKTFFFSKTGHATTPPVISTRFTPQPDPRPRDYARNLLL
jgi:hypothetical protein